MWYTYIAKPIAQPERSLSGRISASPGCSSTAAAGYPLLGKYVMQSGAGQLDDASVCLADEVGPINVQDL